MGRFGRVCPLAAVALAEQAYSHYYSNSIRGIDAEKSLARYLSRVSQGTRLAAATVPQKECFARRCFH